MKNFTLVFIAFSLFAISCTHYHYVPNSQNIPAFREKGEVRFVGAKATGDEYGGLEFQAAYAPLKHVAIQANGFSANGARNQNSVERGRGIFGEAALGTWWLVGKNGVAEAYYGYGGGNVSNTRPGPPNAENEVRKYDFERGFLQTSYTIRNRLIEYSISNRVCGLRYRNLRINGDHIAGTNQGWFYVEEPCIGLSSGTARFKIGAFLTRSFVLTPTILEAENFNFSISINYRLGGKKQWAKEKPAKSSL